MSAMPGLSLDCLTLLDQAPGDLVRIAGQCGYALVSLWVQAPVLPFGVLAVPAMAADLRETMAETGVRVGNLEVFNLAALEPIEAFRPALAFGASLGAGTATAIDYGESAPGAIAERLALFCRIAADYGLRVNVEPISMGHTATIADAAALIRDAGVSDCGIVLDMVHFVRTGTTLADLATIDPALIRYVQLCDGPASIPAERLGIEAMEERLYPGEGDFPIATVLDAIGPHAQCAVEIPGFLRRREQGVTPLAHAAAAMAATRRYRERSGGDAPIGRPARTF
jgi:sugar phosphate isomerase/epimerase